MRNTLMTTTTFKRCPHLRLRLRLRLRLCLLLLLLFFFLQSQEGVEPLLQKCKLRLLRRNDGGSGKGHVSQSFNVLYLEANRLGRLVHLILGRHGVVTRPRVPVGVEDVAKVLAYRLVGHVKEGPVGQAVCGGMGEGDGTPRLNEGTVEEGKEAVAGRHGRKDDTVLNAQAVHRVLDCTLVGPKDAARNCATPQCEDVGRGSAVEDEHASVVDGASVANVGEAGERRCVGQRGCGAPRCHHMVEKRAERPTDEHVGVHKEEELNRVWQ
mmetsp:Transcript_10147/g.32168  ORF Transcript_10147/g.32168 Transcript_10147/m.32168 type:complete len:268 (+) Transcript_10147:559-1362(+)